MLNLYDAVRSNPSYSKLEIGDFLFAEYTCGVRAKKLPNWTQADYLVHVVSGNGFASLTALSGPLKALAPRSH